LNSGIAWYHSVQKLNKTYIFWLRASKHEGFTRISCNYNSDGSWSQAKYEL
jgi:hypothetical protein